MATKRKAPPRAERRPTKRVASGQATPISLVEEDSDVSYHSGGADSGNASDYDDKVVRAAQSNFSLAAYRKKNKVVTEEKRPKSTTLAKSDLSYLPLKPDHETRPLWIDPDTGFIILESFSPLARQAQDFLITIAEPQSRPLYVHEYRLTDQSLLSASSVGLEPQDIIRNLEKFSKSVLPDHLKSWVIDVTESFGKIKLVLMHNQYFIESPDAAALQRLLKDEVIGPCRIEGTEQSTKEKSTALGGLVLPGTTNATGAKVAELQVQRPVEYEEDEAEREADDLFAQIREDDDDDDDLEQVHSFRIAASDVEKVKERCIEIKLPITEEYDFRNDNRNANLDIDLRPSARIRDYQEKSLSKMFGNGRAKSGIIVLPCGAGKTLVGITAACTVRKGVVILCTSSMSVIQWRSEFLKWSNINPNDIAVFTSEHKDRFSGSTGIIVSTYSMVANTHKRSHESQKMMDFLTAREWGLMILDEVHVVPATIFRKVSTSIATHSKLGLTATLLREDNKISDLNYLIGPKLFEANWMELAEQGHIARVQCAEVWCPMTTEFYTEYLRANARKRMLLYTMNPKKFQACQFLIDYHEKRGDKTIVFSDNVYTLQRYAKKLNKFFIFGDTPQHERIRILENFQHNETVNTIFLSKIGDTSLDLPEATCLIQISSHYGSRRQEAQRLGRILRAKRRNDAGFNAFFYSLVSKDTNEMFYSSKRQAFLVDQGYAFKVITHLQGIESMPGLAFNTAQERRELLQDVMLQNEMAGNVEVVGAGEDDMFSARNRAKMSGGTNAHTAPRSMHERQQIVAKRMSGTLGELSGGQDMAYIEYNKGRNQEVKGRGGKNASSNKFVRKLQRENERMKTARKKAQDLS